MKKIPSAQLGVNGAAVRGTTEYKTMPTIDALRELESVLEGLSEAEVEERLKKYVSFR